MLYRILKGSIFQFTLSAEILTVRAAEQALKSFPPVRTNIRNVICLTRIEYFLGYPLYDLSVLMSKSAVKIGKNRFNDFSLTSLILNQNVEPFPSVLRTP